MASQDPKKDGSALGFEAELFKAADKLRGNMEPSDYKHVALGLIFLKYISDSFEAKHKALLTEDRDEYAADHVFWVPKEARWPHLQANARQSHIGLLIDDAMRAIEKDNESLKGMLTKDYARPALNKLMLGDLMDDTPFAERFAELQARLDEQFKESARLQEAIRHNLEHLKHGL